LQEDHKRQVPADNETGYGRNRKITSSVPLGVHPADNETGYGRNRKITSSVPLGVHPIEK